MIVWEDCVDAEATVLEKALYEARFAEEPNYPLMWLSPGVINLPVEGIAEQQRRWERRRRTGNSDSQAWLLWRNQPEQAVVVQRLAKSPELLRSAREDGEDSEVSVRRGVCGGSLVPWLGRSAFRG